MKPFFKSPFLACPSPRPRKQQAGAGSLACVSWDTTPTFLVPWSNCGALSNWKMRTKKKTEKGKVVTKYGGNLFFYSFWRLYTDHLSLMLESFGNYEGCFPESVRKTKFMTPAPTSTGKPPVCSWKSPRHDVGHCPCSCWIGFRMFLGGLSP